MNARTIEKISKRRFKEPRHVDKKTKIHRRIWTSCQGKKRYRTEGEAIHARTEANRFRPTPLDIYYCSYCHGYHLTKAVDSHNSFLKEQLVEANIKKIKTFSEAELIDYIANSIFADA